MTTTIPCIGGPLDGTGVDRDVIRFGVDMDDGSDSYGYERTEFQGMPFFVADTMGPLAARREMRRLYAAQQERTHIYAGSVNVAWIRQQADELVQDAQRNGVVLTISQRPLRPLGMAHYETVVEVRPVQVPT